MLTLAVQLKALKSPRQSEIGRETFTATATVSPSLAPPLLLLLRWRGSNRWRGRAGDDENVKSATFTHLLLYCLSLQEWGVRAGWRVKDAGLTSLVCQPGGLDGIHRLRRLLRHDSLRSHPTASLRTCSHSCSQFLLFLYCQLVLPPPSFPALCVSLLPVCNVES